LQNEKIVAFDGNIGNNENKNKKDILMGRLDILDRKIKIKIKRFIFYDQ